MISVIREVDDVVDSHSKTKPTITKETYMQYLVINCQTGKIELDIKNRRDAKEKLPNTDYDFLLLGIISKATAKFSTEKPDGGVAQA